jgi:flagellar basal-body rod protein FlgB
MNPHNVEAVTLPALSAALDATVIRQQVIANNIANANTEGFRAQRVSFSMALDAAGSTGDAGLTARLEPQVSLSADGAVRLDSEVAAMAQNGAHYQALLKAMNRHLSVLASAVSEGKR